MKKLLLGLLIVLTTYLFVPPPQDSSARLTEAEKEEIAAPKQLLPNGGFESRTSKWESTGSATFSIDSSTPLYGFYSALWDPSAASEYLRSENAITLDPGMEGEVCQMEMRYLWSSGVSGEIRLQALDASNAVLASVDLEPATVPTTASLSFDCPDPSSVQLKFALFSTANAAQIEIDRVFLGSGKNSLQISQASIYGKLQYDGAADCLWSDTSASFTGFTADSDCNVATASGNAQAPGTKIPAISFPSLPAGKYEIVASGEFVAAGSSSGAQRCSFRFHDGTNAADETSSMIGSVNDGSISSMTMVGTFEYTSAQGSTTIEIQTQRDGGNGTCGINADNSGSRNLSFIVKRFPVNADPALTFDTTGWFVDVNIGGSDPNLGTGNVSDYTYITDAGLDLVVNSSKGSAPAQIACVTGESPSGTTCSGNESVGVSFTIPKAGMYQACMQFSHFGSTDAAGDALFTIFQLMETENGTNTVLQAGEARVQSTPDSSTGVQVSLGIPINICSNFNFTTTGQKTIRLFYEQLVTATPTISEIRADRAAAQGQRDIHFYVFPLTQQLPAPVFSEIKNKIGTGLNDWKRYIVDLNCDSGSAITDDPMSMVASIGNISAGACAVTLNSIFTQTPMCMVSRKSGPTTEGLIVWSLATSSTAVDVDCEIDDGSACTAYDVILACEGL